MSYSQLGMPKAIQMKSMTVAHSDTVIKCVYYGWMNSMAMAEGRKCNGYYHYFITAGMVVERKPCVRGKMSENAMRRSKATACML